MKSATVPKHLNHVLLIDSANMTDKLYFGSAGLVGFARGMNDAPKIAALLATVSGIGLSFPVCTIVVPLAMAVGGLLKSRKVTITMSDRITTISHGQGLTENIVTAFLVVAASRFGVPVSTTHYPAGAFLDLAQQLVLPNGI